MGSPEGTIKKSSLTQAALNRANTVTPQAARTLVKWAADDSNAGERLAAAAAVQKRVSRESVLSGDSRSTRSSATGWMYQIACVTLQQKHTGLCCSSAPVFQDVQCSLQQSALSKDYVKDQEGL